MFEVEVKMIWILGAVIVLVSFWSAKKRATQKDDKELLIQFAKNFAFQIVFTTACAGALWWLIGTSWSALSTFLETDNTPDFVRSGLTAGVCLFGTVFTAKTYWVFSGFDRS
jgi:hypothetical protein